MRMKYVEPEGLYPNYRQEITKKISTLVHTGESFKLVAKSGSGKSKYLRYISNSETIKTNYFKDTLLLYIDLNRAYQNTTQHLIKIIAQTLEAKEETGDAIENKIHQLLSQFSKVYLILDQAENLNEFEDAGIKFLRSLRDDHKGKFGFIISCEEEVGLDIEINKYLLEISAIEITFEPLTKQESGEVIQNLAKNMGIKLSKNDIESITNRSKGSPKIIRQTVTKIMAGESVSEAIGQASEGSLPTETSPANENTINLVEKTLTKNEQLFFKEMYRNLNAVVKRDELAILLSPKSQGSGVSDEAIDQVISRTRKSIKNLQLPYHIKTVRGVGYFLEPIL